MAADLDTVFKAYDIRGTVPDQLDAELARGVGIAFARFADAPKVLVARDMRPSGVELSAAFIDGVTATGTDVVELGLASTDLLYFASGRLDAPGAMFTASHNPAGYNGIKLCLSGARPVGEESGLFEIKEAVRSGVSPPTTQRGRVTRRELIDEYAAHVRTFLGTRADALRPLRVVADTANGMGGLVVPAVFADLPFDLEILYGELDGTFPHHPADPIQPENLRDLQALVLERGADIGLAFDGDADRVFLVDERAQPVSGSLTTAMVAATMLDRTGPGPVIHNLICSKAVPEVIREHGGTPVRTRVGHSFIKATMADTGAVFGGEHSGHYYFRDFTQADSGVVPFLLMLELISKKGRRLSEILAPLRAQYFITGELNTPVPDVALKLQELKERYAEARISHLDGISVDFDDWHFNVRPSNTEPLLRLNLEARDRAACDAHVSEVLALIRGGT